MTVNKSAEKEKGRRYRDKEEQQRKMEITLQSITKQTVRRWKSPYNL